MNFKIITLALAVYLLLVGLALGLGVYAYINLKIEQKVQNDNLTHLNKVEAQLMKDEADIKKLQTAVLLPNIKSNAASVAALQARIAADEAAITALQNQPDIDTFTVTNSPNGSTTIRNGKK